MTTSPEALRENKRGFMTAPCIQCGEPVTSVASQRVRGRGKTCSKACAMHVARDARRAKEVAEFGERFWNWVDQSAGPDACWPWLGKRHGHEGYGRYRLLGKYHTAHRYALWSAAGDPPEGKPYALHACDFRPCCNPAHLRWGSTQENSDDMVTRGRSRRGDGQRIDVELALRLREEGRTYAEIAQVFGVRPESAGQSLRRAAEVYRALSPGGADE